VQHCGCVLPGCSQSQIVEPGPSLLLLLLLCADVLECAGAAIEWIVPKSEGTIPITDNYSLTAVLTPTPRWPDAMCIIDPASKVVFTSKLFSAHVAPGLLNSKVSGHGRHTQMTCCHLPPLPASPLPCVST
jgi:hypothetical protein